MQTFFAFFLLILGVSSAQAQTARIDRIETADAGIYTGDVTGETSAPNTAGGVRNTVKNIKLALPTTQVPAQLHVKFGFHFTPLGAPAGSTVALKGVTIFPAPGLHNPDTSTTTLRDEYVLSKTIGQQGYDGYSFDNSWEILPGKWTFEIWQGSRKLAEQNFTVLKP